MVEPKAWAVLRLMASSNFVACSAGKSAGFPLEDLVNIGGGALA